MTFFFFVIPNFSQSLLFVIAQSFPFSCHCAIFSLTKSSGGMTFADEAISSLILFGWSIEEGLFTSSNWKRRDCHGFFEASQWQKTTFAM